MPLPGDDIVGYISRGRGLAIHRRTCPNVAAYQASEADRLQDVEWPVQEGQFFDAPLVLIALSRVGILNEITTIFSQTKTNILQAKATEREDKMGVIEISADVSGLPHLNLLMSRLQDMPDLIRIQRGPVHRAANPRRRVAPRSQSDRVRPRSAARTRK